MFAQKDRELFRGDDFAYEGFYRPDIKKADEIVGLNMNLKGMKGVKDFRKFD